MEKNKVFAEKLDILKREIDILNDRINHIVGNLWSVRQIATSLWLAALGVGLGALSQGNKPIPNVLVLSSIVALIFLFIDARLTRWYFLFKLKNHHGLA